MKKEIKIKPGDFRFRAGKKIKLENWPTRIKPYCESKERYEKILEHHVRELNAIQRVHYAAKRYALLLVFQGMDGAGKDGAIRHVMSGINPQDCEVFDFTRPSAEELKHDFLWRSTCRLPERGRLGIFNRSYYEEVLIVRVHPEILGAQGLPEELLKDPSVWKGRYRSIREMEKHLFRNGTRIIKFFLHLSKEEQDKRLLERVKDPQKNWKLSLDDIRERKLWKQYRKAYETCLGETNIEEAPWYVVPADDKETARLVISGILIDRMKELKMSYPKMDKNRRKELKTIRKML
jgi:PPK2 family polyphosphate:nucleotide phosphotransferase